MTNYPDTTWNGDPRAPWNQPDPPECPECYAQLDPDWKCCPYCETHIDWEAVAYRMEVH